jgi:hypothetical protein
MSDFSMGKKIGANAMPKPGVVTYDNLAGPAPKGLVKVRHNGVDAHNVNIRKELIADALEKGSPVKVSLKGRFHTHQLLLTPDDVQQLARDGRLVVKSQHALLHSHQVTLTLNKAHLEFHDLGIGSWTVWKRAERTHQPEGDLSKVAGVVASLGISTFE